MKLKHEEIKQLMKEYRERAIRIYENENLKINIHGGVQICDEGAFVEAVVWVPKNN